MPITLQNYIHLHREMTEHIQDREIDTISSPRIAIEDLAIRRKITTLLVLCEMIS